MTAAKSHDFDNLPKDIDVVDAYNCMSENNAVLVDVREPNEFAAGHASGAVSIPLGQFSLRTSEIPTDRPVLIICQSGQRSQRASTALRGSGFNNIVNVLGGTSAWLRAGLEIEE